MKKEKIYQLLNRHIDGELDHQDQFKVMQILKEDPWWQREFENMKLLKSSLTSFYSPLPVSTNFEQNLMTKINDYQTHKSIFDKLSDYGIINKLSYGLVTTSIIFMTYLGVKVYFPNVQDIYKNELTTSILSSPFKAKAVSTTSNVKDMVVVNDSGHATIVKGDQTLTINLGDEQPLSNIDPQTKELFNDILTGIEYIQAMYYKQKGDYNKSARFFKECIKKHPKSKLAPLSKKELSQIHQVTAVNE